MANWRSRRLTDNAQHHECQYCGRDDKTIVAAHSNQIIHGKGMGIKAHDCFIAYLCSQCHDIVDGRKHPHLNQQTREDVWTIAHFKTIRLRSVQRLLDNKAKALLASAWGS